MSKSAEWVLIWFLMLIIAGSGCESGPDRRPEVVDGKAYGVTSGAFRGRWWNYYERGLSYGEGHLWQQAEADLREALQLRGQDLRRARTYGMHFIDYFPHRELGIVFYHQGKYQEAIGEFEASLRDEKSAKAEFYLDCARKSMIRQQQADAGPPVIDIRTPAPEVITNAISVEVTGEVRDDSFVKQVTVNQHPVRIDLAAPVVPFTMQLPLEPGENIIRVESLDLSDRQAVTERRVRADWEGPTITIDEPVEGAGSTAQGLRVRGTVYDETGVRKILVNGREVLPATGKEIRLDHAIPASAGLDRMVVEAVDLAGNRTTAEIRLTGGRSVVSRVQLASLELSTLALLGSSSTQDTLAPSIDIKNYTGEQETFLDQVYVEGVVHDEGGVNFLTIDGQSVLRKGGKTVFFSHLARLNQGANCPLIEARDLAGNRSEKRVCFHRKLNKVHEVGARMSMALLPLERKGMPGLAADSVEEALLSDLVAGHRFRMAERRRLEEILREQRMGGSELADPGAAIRVGKIMAATCVLLGSVLEKEGSVEIYLRAVDTETSLILTSVDVYGEDPNPETVRLLGHGLVLKLLDELPLVEGLMVSVKGTQGVIDLGREQRVKRGMRVIVFEEGEPIRHPLTGMVLGADVTEMGRGLIQTVREQMSEVELVGKEAPQRVRTMHKIITQ